MLIAGYYAKRFGKRFLMRIAAVAGLLFYVGMLTVHTPAQLLLYTAENRHLCRHSGRYHALLQRDLMPGQAGAATTLYTNTTRVGWLCTAPGGRCG